MVYGNSFEEQVVVDVGMSNADSAIFFANGGAIKVIGLEPHLESYKLAVANIAANHLEDTILPLNCGLSSTTGTAGFVASKTSPNTGSLAFGSLVKAAEYTEVKTMSLENLMTEYGLAEIDLLKMDCEGCEYLVLEKTPVHVLNRVREIILEFHQGGTKLAHFLVSSGFSVTYEQEKLQGMLRARNLDSSWHVSLQREPM